MKKIFTFISILIISLTVYVSFNDLIPSSEKPLDKYDEKGHQEISRFYTQKIADEVYKHDKLVFDVGGYDKNSWK